MKHKEELKMNRASVNSRTISNNLGIICILKGGIGGRKKYLKKSWSKFLSFNANYKSTSSRISINPKLKKHKEYYA